MLGMKGFAVTDHGTTLGGRLNSVFFERFVSPDPAVKIFKGVECNLLDETGTIDIPTPYLPFLDIVLLGIHSNIKKGYDKNRYTEILVNALEKNSMVDIVTHPNDPNYPIDYRTLAQAAAVHGVAVELNNSKIHYARSSASEALRLLEACKECSCQIAVSSDTHAIHELGDDSDVAPLLQKVNFTDELIVNRTAAAAFDFIEKRREGKLRN
jgi:putative hydrolase